MGKNSDNSSEPIVIKKYANRRLYNTDTSTYVTLDDLAVMVREERDFLVFDAKTKEDLTHAVLTQIIVEQEAKGGQNLLPVRFLRQLIRFYGDSIERLVPSYLELSLDSLTKDQEKYRQQFGGAFNAPALEAMQEQTVKNMAMFEKAMAAFSPFNTDVSSFVDRDSAESMRKKSEEKTAKQARRKSEPEPKADEDDEDDEIAELKAQLAAMQNKLEELSDK